jgi:hypothetical protein
MTEQDYLSDIAAADTNPLSGIAAESQRKKSIQPTTKKVPLHQSQFDTPMKSWKPSSTDDLTRSG